MKIYLTESQFNFLCEYIKSPMNYVGGKSKLLPQIIPLFPKDISTFVDLFCGGCNVGINVSAKNIIYNDKLKQIIDLYQNWKENGIEDTLSYIDYQIKKFGLNKDNKDGFLALKEYYNKTKDIRDLFILTTYSFNNKMSFNNNGEYNQGFGKRHFNNEVKSRLIEFIKTIKKQNSQFINNSFENINPANLPPNSFVYADPPYLASKIHYGQWDIKMEKDLLKYLDECTKNNVKFALSNVLFNNNLSNDILKKWLDDNKNRYHVHKLNIDYSKSRSNRNIKDTVEVLITNY
jgi:DNA adenine methylase